MNDALLKIVEGSKALGDDLSRWILFAVIFALPFTSFPGISALGELQGSLSVHILLVLLLISISTGKGVFHGNTAVAAVILAWMLIVVASGLANWTNIEEAVFRGRTGFGKFASSTIVLVFGFLVTAQLPRLFSSAENFDRFFVDPLVLAVWFAAVFSIPEILSWNYGWASDLYANTTGLLVSTGQFDEVWREPGRLASVAFEAPDLAYFTAFAAPWVMNSYRSRVRQEKSLTFIRLTIGLLFVLVALAGSRTGYVMLAAWLVVEVTCVFVIGRLGVNPLPFAALPAALLILIVGAFVLDPAGLPATIDRMGTVAYDEHNVSNISRSATAAAQLCLFLDNRWFGIGLGQYAFQAVGCLPDWSLASFEIKAWFFSPDQLFPPTFSAIGRIASELGFFGILAFVCMLAGCLIFFVRAFVRTPEPGVRQSYIIACIGSLAVLAMGAFSSDFFRRPDTWILLAVLSSYKNIAGNE